MAYEFATECEEAHRTGGDQEGPSRLERMLEMLAQGDLSERIIATARMAAQEHLQLFQNDWSLVEAEDSAT